MPTASIFIFETRLNLIYIPPPFFFFLQRFWISFSQLNTVLKNKQPKTTAFSSHHAKLISAAVLWEYLALVCKQNTHCSAKVCASAYAHKTRWAYMREKKTGAHEHWVNSPSDYMTGEWMRQRWMDARKAAGSTSGWSNALSEMCCFVEFPSLSHVQLQ